MMRRPGRSVRSSSTSRRARCPTRGIASTCERACPIASRRPSRPVRRPRPYNDEAGPRGSAGEVVGRRLPRDAVRLVPPVPGRSTRPSTGQWSNRSTSPGGAGRRRGPPAASPPRRRRSRAPADVPLPYGRAHAPPGVVAAAGLELPEGVDEPRRQQPFDPGSLLGRTPALPRLGPVREVDLGMGNVEVADQDERPAGRALSRR